MRREFLIDCDGVIADFISSCLLLIERETGNKFSHSDITQWDVFASVGMTKDDWKMLNEEVERGGFCLGMSPYAGAQAFVEALKARGEVYVVTAPLAAACWDHERRLWLERHFNVPKKSVIQTDAKDMIRGDILLDDKPEHIVAWARKHPNGLALLWNQPYNNYLDEDAPKNIKRVHSWEEALESVDAFIKP